MATTLAEKQTRFLNLCRHLCAPNDGAKERVLQALKELCKEYKPEGATLEAFKISCASDSSGLKGEMMNMVEKRNLLWAEIWKLAVQLLGTEIHGSTMLLNSLLKIQESALKTKHIPSIVCGFQCWSVLIDNFAINPEVLCASKRISLLAVPFNSKVARDPETLAVKFQTWWHLIVTLKKDLTKFYNILKDFLNFCFGPFDKNVSKDSPMLVMMCPNLSQVLLKLLAVVLGFGIKQVEEKLSVSQDLEMPTDPIISNSTTFSLLHKNLTTAVASAVSSSPGEEHTQLAIQGLAFRIGQLHQEGDALWQAAVGLALSDLYRAAFDVQAKDHPSLIIDVTQALVTAWDPVQLDTFIKCMSSTSREYLLKILLKKKHLLTVMPLKENEDKYLSLLRTLLERAGATAASPALIDDLRKVVQALGELSQTLEGSSDAEPLTQLLTLWEQHSKIIVKVFSSSTANEECNAISQTQLLILMLQPVNWALRYCKTSYNINYEKLIPSWKHVLEKFVEVRCLSVSLEKQDPFLTVVEQLLELLPQSGKLPNVTVSLLVHLSAQVSAVQHARSSHQPVGLESQLRVVNLMARLPGLLSIERDSRTAKTAIKQLMNQVKTMMYGQPSLEILIAIFAVFKPILCIPKTALRLPDEHLSDVWKLYAQEFARALDKQDAACCPHKRQVRKVLPEVLLCKDHDNIKVQQGTTLLESAICKFLKRPQSETAASRAAAEEAKPTSPLLHLLGLKQAVRPAPKTVGSPGAAVAMPAPSTRASVTKPALEDLDSQDFIKILPKDSNAGNSQTKKLVLTPHQKEVKRRRRDDIPALYQGLSQDTFQSQETQDTLDNFPAAADKPVPRTILFDEDANDAVLEIVPPTPQCLAEPCCETATEGADAHRAVLEPILSNRGANKKDSQDSMDDDEVVCLSYSPSPAKLAGSLQGKGAAKVDTSVKQAVVTSKENFQVPLVVKDGKPDTEKAPAEQPDAESEVEIMEVDAAPEETTESKEHDDSQEDCIVESSQTVATVLIRDSVPSDTAENTAGGQSSLSLDSSKKFLINRQGVSLFSQQREKTKPAESKSVKLRAVPSPGRAAQLLGLVKGGPRAGVKDPKPAPSPSSILSMEAAVSLKDVDVPDGPVAADAAPATITTDGGTTLPTPGSPTPNLAPTPVNTPVSANKRSNLKRYATDVSDDDGCSPSQKRCKRVSFAEPVVSGQQESPKILSEEATYRSLYKRSPSIIDGVRATPGSEKKTRKSLFPEIETNARKNVVVGNVVPPIAGVVSVEGVDAREAVPTQGTLEPVLRPEEDPSEPLCRELQDCTAPVEEIALKLSSPMFLETVLAELRARGIHTVGELSRLEAVLVTSLDIKEPKLDTLKGALQEYLAEQRQASAEEPILLDALPRPAAQPEEETLPVAAGPSESAPLSVEQQTPVAEPSQTAPVVPEETLSARMKKLLAEHSLEEVVRSLGPMGDVLRSLGPAPDVLHCALSLSGEDTLGPVLAHHPVPLVLSAWDRDKEVLDHLAKKNPKSVLSAVGAVANLLTMADKMKFLGMKILQPCKSPSSKLDKKELLHETGSQESAPSSPNAFSLQTFDIPSILKSVGREQQVMEHVVANSAPSAVVAQVISKLAGQNSAEEQAARDALMDWTLTFSNPQVITQKIADKHLASDMVKALVSRDVLDSALADLLNSEDVQGMLRDTRAPELCGTGLAALTRHVTVPQVLKAVGKDQEVLRALVASSGGTTVMLQTAQLMSDEEMTSFTAGLSPAQQNLILDSLPEERRQEGLKNLVSDSSSAGFTQVLMPLLPAGSFAKELARRCSLKKQIPEEVDAEDLKELSTHMPQSLLAGALHNVNEIKKVISQHLSSSELLKIFLDKEQSDAAKSSIPKALSSRLCEVVPLTIIASKLKSAAQAGKLKLDTDLLNSFTINELVKATTEHRGLKSADETSRTALTQHLLSITSVDQVFTLAREQLGDTKPVSPAVSDIILGLAKAHVPTLALLEMVQSRELKEEELVELLEHLMSQMATEKVLALLPIKDLVTYYQGLIAQPEYTGELLKFSFQYAASTERQDRHLLRFYTMEKILELVKKQLMHGKVSASEVMRAVPPKFDMEVLQERLPRLPNSPEAVAMLHKHFPKELIVALVTKHLLNK